MKSSFDFKINARVTDGYYQSHSRDFNYYITAADRKAIKNGKVPDHILHELQQQVKIYEELTGKELEKYDADTERTHDALSKGMKLYGLFAYVHKKPKNPTKIVLAYSIEEANKLISIFDWWRPYPESYSLGFHLIDGKIPKGKILIAEEEIKKVEIEGKQYASWNAY